MGNRIGKQETENGKQKRETKMGNLATSPGAGNSLNGWTEAGWRGVGAGAGGGGGRGQGPERQILLIRKRPQDP